MGHGLSLIHIYVFGEGIDKTQEEGQTELEDYIYLDIIPSGNQSAGRGLSLIHI